MTALFKLFVRLLLVLAVLLVVVVIAVPVFFDPNDFKDEIAARVQQATGRELRIDGDLKLSLFPVLGVRTGALMIGNRAGFGPEPLAEVAAADLSVKLIPLFGGHVEARTLTLKGLRLNLLVDADGQANWRPPAAAAAEAATGMDSQAAGEGPGDAAGRGQPPAEQRPLSFSVDGIRIEDAVVQWRDRVSGRSLLLDGIDIRTGPVVRGQPVDMQVEMGVDSQQSSVTGTIKLDSAVRFHALDRRVELQGLHLITRLRGDGLPTGKLDADLQADGRIDLAQRAIELEPMQLRLDESTVNGRVAVARGEGTKIEFNLAIDRLDLDAYSDRPARAAPVAAEELASADRGSRPAAGPPATADLPVGAGGAAPALPLAGLTVDGSLRVGRLVASGLKLQELVAELSVADQLLTLEPVDFAFYGGHFDGGLTVDGRRDLPQSRLHWTLAGVQLGPMLTDLNGNESLSGTADLKADLSAQGADKATIIGSLAGAGDAAVVEGAYTGIDLLYQLRQAKAMLKGKALPASGAATTDFAELTGSFEASNGVIENRDLSLRSRVLRVQGSGRVDLPSSMLNYGLQVRLTGPLEGQSGSDLEQLKGYAIPVTLSGPLGDPKVRVDLKELLKGELGRRLKDRLGDRLGKFGGLLDAGDGSDNGAEKGDSGGSGGLKDMIPGGLKGFLR